MTGSGFVDEPTQGGGSWGPSVGGGIAAIGGIYDSYQNRKVSRENTDKTIAAQKAESELAYQRSIEMWNRQNEYNTPAAQMARFKAGGLNPHLIYGQGSPGNAQGHPEYRPASMQYHYAAGNYGQAVGSALPMLMSVGSWMQDMRLKELQMRKVGEDIDLSGLRQEQLDQLIKFLQEKNPQVLSQLQNQLSLFPYQKDLTRFNAGRAGQALTDLQTEFRQKYGDDLYSYLPRYKGTGTFGSEVDSKQIGGTKGLEFLKSEAEMRLKRAQASWTDMDITNPQALMQLVLSGVMNLAGTTMKFNQKRRSITHETESRMSTGRVNIRRRRYDN